jgi:DNA-binding response OmpR family regulator
MELRGNYVNMETQYTGGPAPVFVISDDEAQHARLYLHEWKADGEIVRCTVRNYRDLLLTRDIRLVLVDSSERDSTVLNVCSEIRELSDQPLILITYRDDESYLLDAYDVGVSECIVRPVGSQLLEAKIESWLRWAYDQVPGEPDAEDLLALSTVPSAAWSGSPRH